MKEDLENIEAYQPPSCLLSTDSWTPDVDVSPEAIAELCQPHEPICDCPIPGTRRTYQPNNTAYKRKCLD